MENVDTYLKLVAAALAAPTERNIDAVEAFEAEYPEVIDQAYAAGGPYEYDLLTGTVYTK